MRRGDILLIAFPFTDLSSAKVRPALVVSSDKFNSSGEDIILVAISSSLSSPSGNDFVLGVKDPDFVGTGLKKASLIKVGKIALLAKNIARRKLGRVSARIQNEIDTRLKDVLSL